jgi:hypothetical protein
MATFALPRRRAADVSPLAQFGGWLAVELASPQIEPLGNGQQADNGRSPFTVPIQ